MEWYENSLGNTAEWKDADFLKKKVVVLLVRDPDCNEKLMNDTLQEFQKKMYTSFAPEELEMAFIYGDENVCIRDFKEVSFGEICYLDEAAVPVAQSQLFLMADAWIRNQPAPQDITLVVFREADYGMNREDTAWLNGYFTGEREELPCRGYLCENNRKEDAAANLFKKSGSMLITWKDLDALVDKLRG